VVINSLNYPATEKAKMQKIIAIIVLLSGFAVTTGCESAPEPGRTQPTPLAAAETHYGPGGSSSEQYQSNAGVPSAKTVPFRIEFFQGALMKDASPGLGLQSITMTQTEPGAGLRKPVRVTVFGAREPLAWAIDDSTVAALTATGREAFLEFKKDGPFVVTIRSGETVVLRLAGHAVSSGDGKGWQVTARASE
jgi:hypothetical protein